MKVSHFLLMSILVILFLSINLESAMAFPASQNNYGELAAKDIVKKEPSVINLLNEAKEWMANNFNGVVGFYPYSHGWIIESRTFGMTSLSGQERAYLYWDGKMEVFREQFSKKLEFKGTWYPKFNIKKEKK